MAKGTFRGSGEGGARGAAFAAIPAHPVDGLFFLSTPWNLFTTRLLKTSRGALWVCSSSTVRVVGLKDRVVVNQTDVSGVVQPP